MNVVVIGNFGVESAKKEIDFPHDGLWYDYLSGQEIEVENKSFEFDLEAGEFHIITDKKKLPPQLEIPPAKIKVPISFQGYLKIFPNLYEENTSIY